MLRIARVIFNKLSYIVHNIRCGLSKSDFKCLGDKSDFANHVIFKGRSCISLGNNSYIDDFSIISAWTDYRGTTYYPQIIIGNDCRIGSYNHITAINKIVLGDGLLTGKWVTITDNSHGTFTKEQIYTPPALRPLFSKGEVVIGKNVWICDKATITSGVTIGDGCIIAANAVVTKSIPPYSIAAGNPARVVKTINKNNNE